MALAQNQIGDQMKRKDESDTDNDHFAIYSSPAEAVHAAAKAWDSFDDEKKSKASARQLKPRAYRVVIHGDVDPAMLERIKNQEAFVVGHNIQPLSQRLLKTLGITFTPIDSTEANRLELESKVATLQEEVMRLHAELRTRE